MRGERDDSHEHGDDADFAAFLRGEGELARALQSLPQPRPPDALTAAIIARAEADPGRPSPANDSTHPAAGPRSFAHFLRRARVPLGMAASVLFGLTLVFESMHPPAPQRQAAPMAAAPAAAPAPTLEPAPPPPAIDPAPRASVAARPELARPDPPVIVAAPAAAPTPAPKDAATTRMRAAPMPSTAVAAPAAAPAKTASELAMNAEQADAPLAPAAQAMADERARRWLELIDEMSNEGLAREALLEWEAFRRQFPTYPAPPELERKLRSAK